MNVEAGESAALRSDVSRLEPGSAEPTACWWEPQIQAAGRLRSTWPVDFAPLDASLDSSTPTPSRLSKRACKPTTWFGSK